MNISGIYYITNLINYKVYVGSSLNIRKRWVQHKNELNKNNHANSHLQAAWNKYGACNFKFDVIQFVPENKLEEVENQYLKLAQKLPSFYYNMVFDAVAPLRGKFGKEHPTYGRIASQEQRDLIKQRQIGNKNSFYGKKHSSIVKDKISKASTKRQIGSKNRCYDHTSYKFIHKDGRLFTGTRWELYTTFELDKSDVNAIINKTKRTKSVKGWRLLDD